MLPGQSIDSAVTSIAGLPLPNSEDRADADGNVDVGRAVERVHEYDVTLCVTLPDYDTLSDLLGADRGDGTRLG